MNTESARRLWMTGRRAMIRIASRSRQVPPPGTERQQSRAPKQGPVVQRAPPRLFVFDASRCDEQPFHELTQLEGLKSSGMTYWLDFETSDDTKTLEGVAEHFGWHPLVVEDVCSAHQRPKVEDYDGYAYLVLRMPTPGRGLPLEQLNLLLGPGYVVTVQSGIPGDCLEPVRERLRAGRGFVRSRGADYLAYCLLDAVVDHYFPLVEELNARLDQIEESVGTDHQTFAEMHAIRNDLHAIWRAVTATREAVGRLTRGEAMPISDEVRTHLRDCHDHCAQLLDAVGACRELSTSLMDLHQAMVSNRMGEGMRVLTMIATIFMPMTFIAGVYGMNFDPGASPFNMPELRWRYGYPMALGAMFTVGFGFAWFFRRRGWLSSAPQERELRPPRDGNEGEGRPPREGSEQ